MPKLTEGINPATWMLEISTVSAEERMDLDFADTFADSEANTYIPFPGSLPMPHCPTCILSGSWKAVLRDMHDGTARAWGPGCHHISFLQYGL